MRHLLKTRVDEGEYGAIPTINSCGRLLTSLNGSGSTIFIPGFDCESYVLISFKAVLNLFLAFIVLVACGGFCSHSVFLQLVTPSVLLGFAVPRSLCAYAYSNPKPTLPTETGSNFAQLTPRT